METSKINIALVQAAEKGYKIDESGVVTYKNKIVRLRFYKDQYLRFSVRFTYNGIKNTRAYVLAHRLQAYQKYGDQLFSPNICVRHKNADRQDNSYDNILIGTALDNIMDKPAEIRKSIAIHASSFNRILSDEQMIEFRSDRLSGMSYGQLMKKYNISSKGTISFMIQKSSYFNPVPSSSTRELNISLP